jgi:hypothetical protein
MKRCVWLLVLAFCAAVVQVQPVQPLQAKDAGCDCCVDGANACGMPDCAPAPACPPAGALLAGEISTLRAEAESVMPKSRSFRDRCYAHFSPRPARPAGIVPRVAAPTASVPVYQAHCSFLI